MLGQEGCIMASFNICAKKKELDQYPAIVTSHLVNNPYVLARAYKPHFTVYV